MKKLLLFFIILNFTSCVYAQDSINATAHTINSGQSTTLNDVVNTNYSWSNGATTSSITVYPATTTTYTVTRTTNGNIFTGSVLITVNPPDTSFDIDAIALFRRFDSLGISCDASRKILYNNLIKRLKIEKGVDGITSQWNSLDVLYLQAAHAKKATLQNIIQNKYNCTFDVDWANNFVPDKGLQGGGETVHMAVNTNFNPFDGGTYKFKANDNSFGVYINSNNMITDVLVSNIANTTAYGYELVTVTSGGTTAYNGNNRNIVGSDIDVTSTLATKRFPNDSAFYYKSGRKIKSTNNYSLVNTTPNQTFELFCRKYGTTRNYHTTNRFAFTFFGNSNVDIQKLERAVVEEYLKPIGAALTKRVVFDGNSMFSTLTMPKRVIDDLWVNGIPCTTLFDGVWGRPIPQMTKDAPQKVDAFQENYFDKEYYITWEIGNTIDGVNGASPRACLNDWKIYYDARRAAGWNKSNLRMSTSTCLPCASTLSTGIPPAKRENPLNRYDTTTINGLLRTYYKSFLNIDTLCDVALDTLFPDSHGVSGVGELNTKYYLSDQGHLTTVGFYYVADNYIYPQAYYYLKP